MRQCSHPGGCDKEHVARGWCGMHLYRVNTYGDPGPAEKINKPAGTRRCKHPDGCDRPYSCRGWCKTHLKRIERTGDPGPVESLRDGETQNAGRECSVPECVRQAQCRGWCQLHYSRWRDNGEFGPPQPLVVHRYIPGPCSVDGCERIAKGPLCEMHRLRFNTNGHTGGPLKGQAHVCTTDGCDKWTSQSGQCAMHRICDVCGDQRDGKGNGTLCSLCYSRRIPAGDCFVESCDETAVSGKAKYCKAHRGWARRSRSTMWKEYAGIRIALLAKQGGVCGICGTAEGPWDLDHDHKCCGVKDLCDECIRGVLCRTCNRFVLGGAGDSVKVLESAVSYLVSHRSST